jgi:iron complex outermembrane receptor protein
MRSKTNNRRAWMAGAAVAAVLSSTAAAQPARANFTIAAGDLRAALSDYAKQSGVEIFYQSRTVAGRRTAGLTGAYEPRAALEQLVAGTGLVVAMDQSGALMVREADADPQGGSVAGGGAEVEGLIVTAQKREENIQDVPIAMSAFSQETLTERQVAGGPDLITQIPNMSFTKTNFTSYSIQIRGVGTQAISATTDPAVAVAFNNTPFIRNRFFEQEFYDLERLEVLRGPQGTLYGRNATAGVVNLISAKAKFHYEAKASVDLSNYSSRRIEGMVNFPLVEDIVALRIAGAWTQREGFATNQMTGAQIDGRDLWSTRVSLRFEPTDNISANLIWEHFQEDDDRLRSGKQLCKKDVVTQIGGIPITTIQGGFFSANTYTSQGCAPVSLYSPEAFQTPNGYALPFYGPTANLGGPVIPNRDPYVNGVQSRDLRVIESSVEPDYRAKADLAELQIAIDLTDTLTLNSETSYNVDSLFSLQDYNRFTTSGGAFDPSTSRPNLLNNGVYCDPQLGCSDRLLLVDLSTSESSQFSQEFRLGSDFDGPFNFSLGVNYLRHDAEDKYYVFINSLALFAARWFRVTNDYPWIPGESDNSQCFEPGAIGGTAPIPNPERTHNLTGCIYIDPNPIGSLNDEGRNYFLSRNPYKLISYAAFGEAYYELTPALKLTAGLRFTVDKKQAPQIPSWLLAGPAAGAYPIFQLIDQEWKEPTGRLAIDWKPELSFTDDTLVYVSYAHGYKAGGANPPPPVHIDYGGDLTGSSTVVRPVEILPDTFGPEFVDAFEVGTKNTLAGGALTLNLTAFYYDYEGYQTSEIRNRSAVNSNYDAEVWGAEIEADWRVTDALRIGFKGGYNGTRIADGQSAIDLMDRTAGDPNWVVIRPYPTVPSNCILPVEVVTAGNKINADGSICVDAYYNNLDPITGAPYDPSITDYTTAHNYKLNDTALLGPAYANYHGFNPATAPGGGRGIAKDLSGNELPNAPNYTATVTVDYTLPLRGEWLLTFHGDYHYQSESWGRVINFDPYDRIEGFSTVNASAIFTNDDAGWKVMAYVKNVFDETAITGTFLNSDDTGLTTNVFLTEPRLYGLRVTKDFTGGGWLERFGERRAGQRPFTIEIGGGTNQFGHEAEDYAPAWLQLYNAGVTLPSVQDQDLDWGDTRELKLTYAPWQDWRISAARRFGKTNSAQARAAAYEAVDGGFSNVNCIVYCTGPISRFYIASQDNHWRGAAQGTEEHDIIDLVVGREVGFGTWGGGGHSMLGLGLRSVELNSTSSVSMTGVPNRISPPEYTIFAPFFRVPGLPLRTYERYTTSLDSERIFEGVGPTATWESAIRLAGDEERGHADLDWSVTGGVLFGKQTMSSNEERIATYYPGEYARSIEPPTHFTTLYDTPVSHQRTEDVTVPTLSLTLGLSYTVDRVKVSTGYSYDRFFDAVDGGWEDAQTYDRTIHGPYLKLSLGFGG